MPALDGHTPSGVPAHSVFHPTFGTPVRLTAEARDEDDELGTAQTVARMVQYAREDSRHPLIRSAAHRAVGGRSVAPSAAAEAVFAFVRSRVVFVEDAELARHVSDDPASAEVLIRPIDLLAMPRPMGDCDDHSMLCAALLLAVGVPCAFKTTAADRSDPSRYSHVYVMAATEQGPLALDCSHGPYPGWEVASVGKSRLWPVAQGKGTMAGLGSIDWGKLVEIGANTGSTIAKARFGQPKPEAGVYYQEGDRVLFRQQPGAGPLTFPSGGSFAGDSSSLLLLGGVALILFFVARGR